MSGCAFSSWTFAHPSDWGEKLAKKLGWSGGSEADLLEFLESCDSFEMISAQTELFTKEEIFGLHALFPFVPVVEPFESENCFIPKNPIEMARECWSKDVDCIIGATSFEGMINAFVENYPTFDEFKNFLNENIGYFAPVRELKIDASSNKAKEYGRKIKKLYFGDEEFGRENVEKYYHVSSLKNRIFTQNTIFKLCSNTVSFRLRMHTFKLSSVAIKTEFPRTWENFHVPL